MYIRHKTENGWGDELEDEAYRTKFRPQNPEVTFCVDVLEVSIFDFLQDTLVKLSMTINPLLERI